MMYNVSVPVSAWVDYEVEADSAEEAVEKAYEEHGALRVLEVEEWENDYYKEPYVTDQQGHEV